MLAAVRGDVVKTTAGKQVPWEHTSLLGPLVLTANVDATPPPAPPPPASAPTRASEVAEAWALIKDSNSVAALDAFIRRYGDTFHGDLAKARLAELTKPKPTAPVGSAQPSAQPPNAATAVRGPSPTCNEVLPFLKHTGAFGSKPIVDVAYAERVTYFKRGLIARAELIRIAREYESKYPTRIYEIDDKTIVVTEQVNDVCNVRFQYNYIARNAAEERSGRGASDFTVRKVGSSFEIIAETGDVLSRDVKKLR